MRPAGPTALILEQADAIRTAILAVLHYFHSHFKGSVLISEQIFHVPLFSRQERVARVIARNSGASSKNRMAIRRQLAPDP